MGRYIYDDGFMTRSVNMFAVEMAAKKEGSDVNTYLKYFPWNKYEIEGLLFDERFENQIFIAQNEKIIAQNDRIIELLEKIAGVEPQPSEDDEDDC